MLTSSSILLRSNDNSIIPKSGRILVNGRDAALKRVLGQGVWTPVETFGTPGGWEGGPPDSEGSFEVAWQGRAVGRLTWDLVGEFNRMNALAAIGAAHHAGVAPEAALVALASFRGVRRRMELRGKAGGVGVYDDFAHHPTAIRESITGLRQRERGGRILAVFEPRSNTLKRGALKEALPGSFQAADLTYVYCGGLAWNAAEVFAPLGARVRCSEDLNALVAAVAEEARAGDHILVMSNGGFGGIHEKLLDRLSARV